MPCVLRPSGVRNVVSASSLLKEVAFVEQALHSQGMLCRLRQRFGGRADPANVTLFLRDFCHMRLASYCMGILSTCGLTQRKEVCSWNQSQSWQSGRRRNLPTSFGAATAPALPPPRSRAGAAATQSAGVSR